MNSLYLLFVAGYLVIVYIDKAEMDGHEAESGLTSFRHACTSHTHFSIDFMASDPTLAWTYHFKNRYR